MSIYDTIQRVDTGLARGHAEEPQRVLEDLMRNMSRTVLEEWRADLQDRIDKFQPKRRRKLQLLFDERTHDPVVGGHTELQLFDRSGALLEEKPTGEVDNLHPEIEEVDGDFKARLTELGEKHIFQWSTAYLQSLNRHFEAYRPVFRPGFSEHAAESIKSRLHEHTATIFSHGYEYVRNRGLSHEIALQKSIHGLASFLDLCLDYYSRQVTTSHDWEDTSSLRALISAATSGILTSYSDLQFGRDSGDTLLAQYPERWVYQLAFLSEQSGESVIGRLADGSLRAGLERAALPLLTCLDNLLMRPREKYFPMPIVGQFSRDHRCLDVGVRSPRVRGAGRLIYLRVYLDEAFASEHSLGEAAARRFGLVLAPLRPDVSQLVRTSDHVGRNVVEVEDMSRSAVADRALEVLSRRIYELRSKIEGARPITYNVAHEFPLHMPGKSPFYHVRRTSVRDVLARFDRKNGVRLWCSVRRSGKTTACFDLDITPGGSVIVAQTCGTDHTDDGNVFYEGIREATESATPLNKDFVESVVRKCAPLSVGEAERTVLIIDEYETLFGYLAAMAESNPTTRYVVAQPLLNQLVEFARDNLLVLLGQQPGAHFILMDQNQLAPYVKQDPFPLFEHQMRAGEFSQLVEKVLRDQINVSVDFLDALHAETAGHPFLTVNILRVLVDWLIEQKRPGRGITLDEDDFTDFQTKKLGLDQMILAPDYDFFREAAKDAMGTKGYRQDRWLYTAYWLVRKIARAAPETFTVTRSDVPDLLKRVPAPGPLPESNEMLRTASQANFLSYTDDTVAVKVRTLGRLSAAVRPAQA